MKIRALELAAFGAFLDRRLELPDAAVVVGPNEAGKTTLFHALTTTLYGFEPANEAQFPYTPRAGRRAELEADLVLDGGASAHVRRRLLASPDAQWETDGGREELRNRPLPVADHVDRRLYKAVYALTIEDMQALEGEAFARVEQRLLGELGNPWQRPAREVAGELDEEAKRQWRRDKRGKNRYRELQKEQTEQRKALKAAKERQEELRGKEARRAELAERLEALNAERAALADRIRRSEEVGQLRRDLARLDRLAEGLGDPAAVRRLGEDPRRDWTELERRAEGLEARVREQAEAVGKQRARRDRVTASDRNLVADTGAAGVTAAAAKAEDAADARDRAGRAEEQARAELREQAEAALAGPWEEDHGEVLDRITPAELRDRAAAAASAAEEAREKQRRLEEERPPEVGFRLPGIYLVAPLALAVVLVLAGILWWPLWALAGFLGLVALGAGAWNLYAGQVGRQARADHEERRAARERARDEAGRRCREAVDQVARLLDGLPVP
ncbi:MAG: AAA family ATPase, partial [Thiohalospira sp.]